MRTNQIIENRPFLKRQLTENNIFELLNGRTISSPEVKGIAKFAMRVKHDQQKKEFNNPSKRKKSTDGNLFSNTETRNSSNKGISYNNNTLRLNKNGLLYKILNSSKNQPTKPLLCSLIIKKNLLSSIKKSEENNEIKIINDIIFNENTHIVSIFKDYLIHDDTTEFLKRFYKSSESTQRLPKIYEFYLAYSQVFPNYIGIPENLYMFKNIEKKQKRIDNQQKDLEKNEKMKEKLFNDSNLSNKILTTNFMNEIYKEFTIITESPSNKINSSEISIKAYLNCASKHQNQEPRNIDEMNFPDLIDKFFAKDSQSIISVEMGKNSKEDQIKTQNQQVIPKKATLDDELASKSISSHSITRTKNSNTFQGLIFQTQSKQHLRDPHNKIKRTNTEKRELLNINCQVAKTSLKEVKFMNSTKSTKTINQQIKQYDPIQSISSTQKPSLGTLNIIQEVLNTQRQSTIQTSITLKDRNTKVPLQRAKSNEKLFNCPKRKDSVHPETQGNQNIRRNLEKKESSNKEIANPKEIINAKMNAQNQLNIEICTLSTKKIGIPVTQRNLNNHKKSQSSEKQFQTIQRSIKKETKTYANSPKQIQSRNGMKTSETRSIQGSILKTTRNKMKTPLNFKVEIDKIKGEQIGKEKLIKNIKAICKLKSHLKEEGKDSYLLKKEEGNNCHLALTNCEMISREKSSNENNYNDKCFSKIQLITNNKKDKDIPKKSSNAQVNSKSPSKFLKQRISIPDTKAKDKIIRK